MNSCKKLMLCWLIVIIKVALSKYFFSILYLTRKMYLVRLMCQFVHFCHIILNKTYFSKDHMFSLLLPPCSASYLSSNIFWTRPSAPNHRRCISPIRGNYSPLYDPTNQGCRCHLDDFEMPLSLLKIGIAILKCQWGGCWSCWSCLLQMYSALILMEKVIERLWDRGKVHTMIDIPSICSIYKGRKIIRNLCCLRIDFSWRISQDGWTER